MSKRLCWFVLLFCFFLIASARAGQAPTLMTTVTLILSGGTTEVLKPFGYDMFVGQEPTITGPADEDYVVGPKDELLIETWGEYVKKWPVRVSDDGYIDIPEPEAQRVYINGRTLKQVKDDVTRALAAIQETLFNMDSTKAKAWVDVRATRVRPIVVYVTGEVYKPGTVRLDSTVASLINVLTTVWGIKTIGSLRHVKVSRAETRTTGTKAVEELDLYDFLIRGETKPIKTRLRNGDTVFIDLKRKNVAIRGSVRRPGLYEMLDVESLRDLLEYAGGPTPGAYLKRVQVVRRALNQGVRTLDVDYGALDDAGTTFPLLDGDVVEIFPAVEEEYVVNLQGGGVYRSGVFQFTEGMLLSDLIEKGEGMRGEAYLEKADLIRTRIDFTKEYRSFSMKELYRKNPETGKVELIGGKTNPANFPLRRLDKVVIYSEFEIVGKDKKVRLEGHVKQPGEYLLAEKMKISDLLFAYGGFEDPDWRKAAYLDSALLIRTRPEDVRTTTIAFSLGKVLDGDVKEDRNLQSMDLIKIFSFDEIKKKDRFVRLEGHVKRPGDYRLSENTRLSALLFAYGGFGDADFKKATYLERADIWRTNPQDLSVSLLPVSLDKVLAGDPQADPLLQSLDRIVIYEYKDFYPNAYFTITGAVREPGRYLLAQNATLNDAILMAHGLLDEAYKYEAEIIRRVPARISVQEPAEVIKTPISENYATEPREKAFKLMKDDEVFIRRVPGWEKTRTVAVKGQVQFPGQYILSKAEERLSDLLKRAGGVKETAYLPGVVFTRRADEASTASERIRMAIDLKRAVDRPNGAADVILRDGDELQVPINPMMVEVRGAVHVPAVVQYQKGRGLDYYVGLCGGYRSDAQRRDALILNPDGTATRRGWGWFGAEPRPGSVIVVPPHYEILPGGIGEVTTPTLPVGMPSALWPPETGQPELETTTTLGRFEGARRRVALPRPGAALTTGTFALPLGPYVLRRGAFGTTETLAGLTTSTLELPPLRIPIP
jgi:protein involved in polysaccharide export with SLBB domain